MIQGMPAQRRWLALFILCLGDLMIVLDTTIVNVALPSIRADLGFDETALVWVVNAYMLSFGGFLLLGGRLGDLFGHRKIFLCGIALFTLASLGSGLAQSLMMDLFADPDQRAKVMCVFVFVMAGGGSLCVLVGGLLTAINWHLIFLV